MVRDGVFKEHFLFGTRHVILLGNSDVGLSIYHHDLTLTQRTLEDSIQTGKMGLKSEGHSSQQKLNQVP